MKAKLIFAENQSVCWNVQKVNNSRQYISLIKALDIIFKPKKVNVNFNKLFIPRLKYNFVSPTNYVFLKMICIVLYILVIKLLSGDMNE